MKTKRFYKFICFLSIMMVCLTSCSRPKHYVSSAKFVDPPFIELSELEDKSPIIVIGRKTGEIGQPEDEYIHVPMVLLTEFEIMEVIKDDTNILSESDRICVTEWEMYNKETNAYTHLEGYTKMNDKDPYLLFLAEPYSVNGQLCYGGELNYGVVCLGNEYKMIRYSDNETDEIYYQCIDKVRQAAREKYMNR